MALEPSPVSLQPHLTPGWGVLGRRGEGKEPDVRGGAVGALKGSVLSDPWWEQVALTPWACWELWAGKDVCALSLLCNSGQPPAPSAGHTQQAGWAHWTVRGLSACRGPRRELQTCGLRGPPEGVLRAHSAQCGFSHFPAEFAP